MQQKQVGVISRTRLLATQLLGLAMVLASCSQEADLLHGQWQAIEITQAGDSMRLDPSEVSFAFQPSGIYQYRSTLNYQEAGHYRYEMGHLFATDTIHEESEERVVAAQLIGTDSLRIRMKHDTTDRFMLFIKQ